VINTALLITWVTHLFYALAIWLVLMGLILVNIWHQIYKETHTIWPTFRLDGAIYFWNKDAQEWEEMYHNEVRK